MGPTRGVVIVYQSLDLIRVEIGIPFFKVFSSFSKRVQVLLSLA
jgi:hypothetical protein